MDRILDRLYLGDFVDAEHILYSQCQHVLTLCETSPRVSDGIALTHVPIPDEVWLDRGVWGGLVHTLHQLVRTRQTILVNCRLGKSRSPALVAAYLATCGWRDPDHALVTVLTHRSMVAPHAETWRGVAEWWNGQIYA